MNYKNIEPELEYQYKLKTEELKEVLIENISLLQVGLKDIKSKIEYIEYKEIDGEAIMVILKKADYEWLLKRIENLIEDRKERLGELKEKN